MRSTTLIITLGFLFASVATASAAMEACPAAARSETAQSGFRIIAVNSLTRGRAAVVAAVPGAGTLVGRQAKRGIRLVKAASVDVDAAARVKVVLKPTAAAREKLKRMRLLKVRVRATFLPVNGQAESIEQPAWLPGAKYPQGLAGGPVL